MGSVQAASNTAKTVKRRKYLMFQIFILVSVLLFVNCRDQEACPDDTWDICCNEYKDDEEGCRWIFTSDNIECCFAVDQDLCQYKRHDEECRKKDTDYKLNPVYHALRPTCTITLFNVGF